VYYLPDCLEQGAFGQVVAHSSPAAQRITRNSRLAVMERLEDGTGNDTSSA